MSKNPSQKRAGGVAHGVDPEFKPQYCKTNKKTKKRPKIISYTTEIRQIKMIWRQADTHQL
jgi:hypothetical protein